ncbi:hypothetical protein GOP47_0027964 [Adiantum capillus-veneris]|nr:hypothetical protein GOP47_0027964 [Adiantum capillus-veneris]
MDTKLKLDGMYVDKLSYGETQHFYIRRHKRLAEQHAPSQLQELQTNATSETIDQTSLNEWVSGQELSDMPVGSSENANLNVVRDTPSFHLPELNTQSCDKASPAASAVPDQMTPTNNAEAIEVLDQKTPANNADFEKDLANDQVPSPEKRSLNIHSNVPSLTLPESDSTLQNLQATKSTSKERQALRWSRELMKLIADGQPLNTNSTEVENGDISNRLILPARKRRRLCTSIESGNADVGEHFGLQNPPALNKDAQCKWRDIRLSFVDPLQLIGCKCKVYWPDDKDWYTGIIRGYDAEVGTHHVFYDDGDKEDLILSKERVRLYLSENEMRQRKMPSNSGAEDRKRSEFQEMAVLASVFEDFQEEFRHGELVWAKIKGHPMWPAFVVDDKHADVCGLDAPVRETTLSVQFFGTYDFAKISSKHVLSFSKGLKLKFYGKCKKAIFDEGIKEAERYLKEGKLPEVMSKLQQDAPDFKLNPTQMNASEEDQDFMGDERTHKTKKSVESLYKCPIILGDLEVLSLGKIVRDSEFFHTENQIWTEGYSAVRKFTSIKNPDRCVEYRMEITKDSNDRTKPLFRVMSVDGELAEGSTPSLCWKKIYQKLEKAKERFRALGVHSDKKRVQTVSGDSMFGFTNPQILKLIQGLPSARACFKFTGWIDKKLTENVEQLIPAGFKPVEIDWKHADRCSVCDLDEEYTNNLFLQCDRCRILVHMHCYGESELPNGHLWLCQLCRSGLSAQTSLCCLCPVQGGAMKKTTDERWAHLTCAMWIPETCFVDVKSMEPIDGLQSINKERWKLTCNICKVPYGVCIQCSEASCYAAYHVLCARSSGCALEVAEDSANKLGNGAEDLDEPVRFLSYCKRHRQLRMEKGTLAQQSTASKEDSGYCPPKNNSGCARTEPYNGARRRGRQEPEVRAAAAAKRHYVEKMPYFVSGFSRKYNGGSDCSPKLPLSSLQASNPQTTKPSISGTDVKHPTSKVSDIEPSSVGAGEISDVCSLAQRFQQMCLSLKHRLTFGKSAIHGWGVFTKTRHRAGDMVIEYAGEVVRPIVADLRERLIYNTLVGAGTYMFRIDDERVVDATREGSIAHLINHSCEPNCFSRVVTVKGEEHIIIFAKRDIAEGEELSYDYRFNSKGEQLECFCGFPSCRGFVNVNEAEEETNRVLVPRSEITAWTPIPP